MWLNSGQKQQRHPRLDDTESIRSFSDSSASNVPEQQPAYDLGYEKTPRKSLRRAENRKAQGQSDKQPQYYGLSDFVEPEWQAHVAEEKRRLGLLSSDPVEDDNARGFDEDEYDQYNDFEVDQKGDLRIPGQGIVLRDTPSKAPGVPPMAPPTQPSIIKDQPAPVPAKKVSQPDVQKHSTRSSSIGSSDEEIRLPPQQPQLGKHPKRPHSEVESLDYDPFVLKTMTYADLERVMYTTDPRTPASKPTVDTHGLALALPDKLANMSRMQQVDIKSMFETQTDAERQETGAWFVAEMTEMMKNVVKVRVERRKLALGFEMEARRRQKLVEMKTAELEGELKGLKTGGGELIANRKSHGKGVGKTGNVVA